MAEELYGEAVDWDPKLAVALAGLGRIALARRDSDRAALYLERARAEQPEVSEVLYALGHFCYPPAKCVLASTHLRNVEGW